MSNRIEIYTTLEGDEVAVHFEKDNVWLSQNEIASLFGQTKQNISLHIRNCFQEGELEEASTVKKSLTVQKEGNRKVKRNILHYNLDVIISVGYRVNSKKGTQFRMWATERLKSYLVHGYAINKKRLEQKEMQVNHLKTGIQILSRALEEKATEPGHDWLLQYATGLELLDDYDHEELDTSGKSKLPAVYPSISEYVAIIDAMKATFKTAVFGVAKDKSFESAVAQIAQGFGDVDAYPSLEEKAAMLLYLVTKNHAFADGNKRIAASCFLLFLDKNQLLTNEHNKPIISNEALASLTLFVASSKPEEMTTVKNLIVSVLNRNQLT